MTSKETEFLAGKFFTFPIPKARRYLLKYFCSDLERQFLRYYFWVGGDMSRFTAHTGYYIHPRWSAILLDRIKKLVHLNTQARGAFSEEGMSTLARIERGELKLMDLDKIPIEEMS